MVVNGSFAFAKRDVFSVFLKLTNDKMGNKSGRRRKAISYPTTQTPTDNEIIPYKEQNETARNILIENVQGIPDDDDIKVALAVQQSRETGPLKRLDYISILIRLNPARDNALISQYKMKDLTKLIRYELYTSPLTNVVQRNKVVIE